MSNVKVKVKVEQHMRLSRNTKGTHFYEAVLPDTARIRSLYIQKEAFQGNPPPTIITVTVEETE